MRVELGDEHERRDRETERQPAQRASKHSLLTPPAQPLPGEQKSGVSLLSDAPDPQAEPSAKALEHVFGKRDGLKK